MQPVPCLFPAYSKITPNLPNTRISSSVVTPLRTLPLLWLWFWGFSVCLVGVFSPLFFLYFLFPCSCPNFTASFSSTTAAAAAATTALAPARSSLEHRLNLSPTSPSAQGSPGLEHHSSAPFSRLSPGPISSPLSPITDTNSSCLRCCRGQMDSRSLRASL